MNDSNLALSLEERDFLVDFLETARKNTLVEEHRTRTLNYREQLRHREELIDGLLSKLGRSPHEAAGR